MKKNITAAIVHGTRGSPTGNWFPWLEAKLNAQGIKTTVPKFPTPEGQTLKGWRETFAKEAGPISPNMLLFGHSIGAALLLDILSRSKEPCRAAFLVSGFAGQLGLKDFDPLTESFFLEPFDWNQIRRNAGEFFVYAGDDDQYVPLKFGIEIATNLKTELIVVPKGGHLNLSAGFTTFPRLLRDVERLVAGT